MRCFSVYGISCKYLDFFCKRVHKMINKVHLNDIHTLLTYLRTFVLRIIPHLCTVLSFQ